MDNIKLYKEDGTILGGYVPFIIRPLDNVQVPRDLKRDNDIYKCSWPLNAGSKFQQWCSEENAIDYYAMRPNITPDTYNNWLQILFNRIAPKKMRFKNPKWSSIFCDNSREQLMNFIMIKVAEEVSKIPEMHKNGSWKYEQFHWTDADIYQFIDENNNVYYNILFNLYNPLRSISTQVECTLLITDIITIVYMGFVNNTRDKSDIFPIDTFSTKTNKIIVKNDLNELKNDNSVVDWNYANTLLKQEFNQYGFYNNDNNIKLKQFGISDTMKNKINQISNKSNSYLLPAGKVNYTGVVENKVINSNIPRVVEDNYVIFNSPLELVNKDGNLVSVNKFNGTINKGKSFVPKNYPINIIK